ncbi:hypothetical protein I302_102437 [Kwoniella bestiolae CBS 10118]|uniref:N-acetylglucosaminylphosphatidylinositol deacetylase n=1 Tax=Kwoniella bestiolae CBS 10118 TaxID=1296100 RepID=A0AAJ8K419_9TREE
MPPTPRHPKSSAPSTPRAISPLLLFSFLLPLLALLFPYSHLLPSSSREPHFSSYVRFDSTSTTHSPKALLLTAHPDDEVMFFSPTILSLVKEGWEVSGLCLSTGNSSGLGQIRTEELHSSYEYLGVDRGNVKVVDHPNLQDSMSSHWDPELIADLLNNHLKDHPVDLIITFDSTGITHHPNHISLPLSLPLLSCDTKPRILHLISPGVIPKFTGPVYPIYLNIRRIATQILGLGSATEGKSGRQVMITSSPARWVQSIQAMMAHRSQLVWFRWLYLAASKLMWVNELIEV